VKPLDLLATADVLLKAGNGKPTQSNLRRALSTAYYALFHCLARDCADTLLGGVGANRSQPAWRQTYRALDHGTAKAACRRQIMTEFPQSIVDFANLFHAMQIKRHEADYDPDTRLYKSDVVNDVALVRQAIIKFKIQPIKDRRAFCVHVLFKVRQ
jgi:hypothetical protein